MPYGLPWSEAFIAELSDKEIRDEFVADQVRARIAMLIRALREQDGRAWSQAELGRRMAKPQNVVSRLEDPDYGRQSLQTLLEVAAAFDLPLWVDILDWDEWLRRTGDLPKQGFFRESFNAEWLTSQAQDRLTSLLSHGAPMIEEDRSKVSGDAIRAFEKYSSERQNAQPTPQLSSYDKKHDGELAHV
jgi:hypothetical protein